MIAARLSLALEPDLRAGGFGWPAAIDFGPEAEAEILAAARKIVQTDPDVGARSVLVVAGDGWHRGVIGIVASKLVDAFHRPAIVLSIDGEIAHGSCRSIPAFDMLGALERCAQFFLRFGGHRQAAGVTLESARIRELRLAINLVADETLATFKAYRAFDDFENMPLHGTFLIDGNGFVRWQDISYQPFTDAKWLLAEAKRLNPFFASDLEGTGNASR